MCFPSQSIYKHSLYRFLFTTAEPEKPTLGAQQQDKVGLVGPLGECLPWLRYTIPIQPGVLCLEDESGYLVTFSERADKLLFICREEEGNASLSLY